MANLYKWTTTRSFPIVRDGTIRGKGIFDSEYTEMNFRNTGPSFNKTIKGKFSKKYKTNMGDAKLEVELSMVAKQYQVGNPSTGVPENIWEGRDLTFKAKTATYPTGYTMDVQPYIQKTIPTIKNKKFTTPILRFILLVKIGPMVGYWTEYKEGIYFYPQSRKIKY